MPLAEYPNAGIGNWLFREDFYRLGTSGREIFRLQVHPVYKVEQEQEEFERYLRTGIREVDPDDPVLVGLRERIAAGKVIRRVYVVEPPLNHYQRYVFHYYHHSCEAGEDLRVIDLSRQPGPGLPDYDFLLVDDKTVIKLHYDKIDGTQIGPELLPDADVTEYRRYRDLALREAIPFLEYEKTIDD